MPVASVHALEAEYASHVDQVEPPSLEKRICDGPEVVSEALTVIVAAADLVAPAPPSMEAESVGAAVSTIVVDWEDDGTSWALPAWSAAETPTATTAESGEAVLPVGIINRMKDALG